MARLRILLADNDQDYRESLARLLGQEGYSVKIASSPEEARAIIEVGAIDVVLADLRLSNNDLDSDLSGIGVADAASQKDMPCILITAFDTAATARLALRSLGANPPAVDYVTKRDGPVAVLAALRGLHGLSILHVSDLHPKANREGEAQFDQDRAYARFMEDWSDQAGLALDPIQAIAVSGDISFQCTPESFIAARRFLEDLAGHVGLPLKNVILTPGNHDVNRLKARTPMDSLQAMSSGSPEWFGKFDRYLEFADHFYGEPAFQPDRLFRIAVLQDRVAIVAFNSCLVEGDPRWMCNTCMTSLGKEHYAGWLDRRQVVQAGKALDLLKVPALRIGMFHHHIVPEEWNPATGECKGDHLWPYHDKAHLLKFTLFEAGFKLLLHGHRHKLQLRQPQTVGTNVPKHFGSGAFWRTEDDLQETANYLVLQLSPIPGRSRVVMRKYCPATSERPGHWATDDSIRPDGVIPLAGTMIPPLDQATQPVP